MPQNWVCQFDKNGPSHLWRGLCRNLGCGFRIGSLGGYAPRPRLQRKPGGLSVLPAINGDIDKGFLMGFNGIMNQMVGVME